MIFPLLGRLGSLLLIGKVYDERAALSTPFGKLVVIPGVASGLTSTPEPALVFPRSQICLR